MEGQRGPRINKYLSEIGYCSRRAADKLIEQGRVTLNGKKPVSATRVKNNDVIRIDGNPIDVNISAPIYLAFYKPVGIVSTTDTKGEKDNIIDYINYPRRIFPIGRLDKQSEGLIFLTSDGDIVNKILRSSNNHEKEYQVTVDKPITAQFIERMSAGIPILGKMTRKCKVVKTSAMSFEIILTQGMNRQIRRMCEYLGYEVKKLKRTRIMNIELDVPVGQWRELTVKELEEIRKLVASSSSMQKASARIKSTPPKKKASRFNKKKSHPGKRTDHSGKNPGSKTARGGKSARSGKKSSRGGRRPK